MTYAIALSEEQTRQLQKLAEASGMEPERLLNVCVEQWLSSEGSKRDFAEAASRVLKKNQELYRRLA